MTNAEASRSSDGHLDRFPLSANLELLCILDKGDDEGAFGPHDLISLAWRVAGSVDIDALQGALDDVVARNEILRTEIVRTVSEPYQRVLPPTPAEVVVIDLSADDPRPRDERADEFINQIEYSELSAAVLPHIRAVVGRFDERDSVLVLLTHHVASDTTSMQVLIRELAAYYAQRTGSGPADLPDPVQYKEFSTWQQEFLASGEADRARAFWRDELSGAQLSAIPTDQRAGVPHGYAVHRFVFPTELSSAIQGLAQGLRASPADVLFGAYNALLYKRTGKTDVVAGTLTEGRSEPRYATGVGPFFNLMPVRTDLTDARSFAELVTRTGSACAATYSHELPFAHISAEAPELTKPYADEALAVCALQIVQFPKVMDETKIGDLTYTEVRERLQSYPDTSEIPNGLLFTVDLSPSGEIAGQVRYNKAQFHDATISELVGDYRAVLTRAAANPAIGLNEL